MRVVDGNPASHRRKDLPEGVASWHTYEALKADWIRLHPDASPAEYAEAVRAIAKRLGL